MASMADGSTVDLDYVLVHELGQFGRFQAKNVLLLMFAIMTHATILEFNFSAAALPTRCAIPECDGAGDVEPVYNPPWLVNATPSTEDSIDSCNRYALVATSPDASSEYCPAYMFDPNTVIPCEEYVYDRTNSVVYDFGLECQEWLRTLAGTLSSVGTLLVLPVTGFVSDRWGRRVALIISVFNLALFGAIRAASVNYPMYLVFQILQTTLGAGTFSSAYVFATELVGPKFRVLTSATMSSMFAVGQVVLGSMSWLIQPWRHMIIAIHAPCFLIISYYWLLSESVRWLLSKEKFDEAKKILEKVARVNKRQISEKSMYSLMNPPRLAEVKDENGPGLFKTIIRSPTLLRRVCTTPVWWITTTFVYYGLSINSVGLSGNMYLNYIITAAIEIPGFYTAALVLNIIGRKITISCGFLLSAGCCIAFAFLPSHLENLALALFLIGKFAISVVFTSLYLFTSELYPTQYRHSLLAFSSMIGRIGSITAPLTPALAQYWDGIPSLMFGVMGLISGLLVLTQPETLGTKMPDTLEEAEALGKTPKLR